MGSVFRVIDHIGDHGGSNLAKGLFGYGTARLLARHCHGKKDATGRVPMGLAISGKVFPALVQLFLGDVHGPGGAFLGALDAVGQGALDFMGVVHGLRDARKEKGIKVIGVPIATDVKALPAGALVDTELLGEGQEVLGALDRAQPGASMTLDQLRELQAYR